MEVAGVMEVGLNENCLIEHAGRKVYESCLSCHAKRKALLG